MTGDPRDNNRRREAFRAEVKRSTRATAVAGGLIAIVAFPVWAGFDHLVDPAHGAEFTRIRLLLELPLVALWLSLFTGPGRRHPELVMFVFMGLIQVAIAYMTARVEDAYAPYALGLSLAVIVNQKIRGQTFFRAAFYFPAIASSAAIVVLFTFLTQPNGLINTVLGFFGVQTDINWTNDPRTALPSIELLVVWTTSGTILLFYLAALQSISNELYEAAAIDGATWWTAFWGITFPLLKPAHFFASAVSVIGALLLFDLSFIAGGAYGAPANALTTVVLYLYRATTRTFELGYAAASGVVLLVLIMALTLVQRRLFGQTEVG